MGGKEGEGERSGMNGGFTYGDTRDKINTVSAVVIRCVSRLSESYTL